MKKDLIFFMAGIFTIILVLSGIISCQRKFDEPPAFIAPNISANNSIKALKAMHTMGGLEQINTDMIISGIVVGDDKSSNLYKQICIQDSTGGITVNLGGSNLYVDYPVGRKIFIKCKGLYISDYNRLIQIGMISKTVGLGAALLGSVVGGLLMPYLGVIRALWIFGILQLSSNLLYAWLAVVGKNILIMSVAMFGENFCGGLATIAFLVYLMGICDLRYTATQYALFSAVASLGRIFIGPVSAVVVAHVGWTNFYIF